jgi:hypothetical protein
MSLSGNNAKADFDPTRTIVLYRNIIEERDAASDKMEQAELGQLAQMLRDGWKDWRGKDSLHEMAFGEPQN